MNPMKKIISLILLSPVPILSQQQVRLFTTSSQFTLSLTSPRTSWNAHEYFQFESATSKLFHTKLSEYDDQSFDSHAVVTGVHVDKISLDGMIMNVDSVVSVTLSEVGLQGALMRGLDEGKDDISAVLSKTVTNTDMMNVLLDIGLADAVSIADMTFVPFQGSVNERGVYTTDTDLVSTRKNSNWPMFFAGVMITLLLCGITAMSLHTYLKENGTWTKRQPSNKSVHYEGDVDAENGTTASGVLGLKGHHPEAEDKENAHPNNSRRRSRKSQGAILSSLTMETDEVTFEDVQLTPCSMTSQSVASASRHPVGITSMRKLNSFLTPQRHKSDKMTLYDVGRWNSTP